MQHSGSFLTTGVAGCRHLGPTLPPWEMWSRGNPAFTLKHAEGESGFVFESCPAQSRTGAHFQTSGFGQMTGAVLSQDSGLGRVSLCAHAYIYSYIRASTRTYIHIYQHTASKPGRHAYIRRWTDMPTHLLSTACDHEFA